MNTPSAALFRTVSRKDYLQFGSGDAFEPQRVAQFMDLNRSDVAKVSGVALSSVRFDKNIPKDVLERFKEIANICGLVAQFFGGDVAKTSTWFKTKNPMLGNLAPRDMIRFGRYQKLLRYVIEALEENSAVSTGRGAQGPGRSASAQSA